MVAEGVQERPHGRPDGHTCPCRCRARTRLQLYETCNTPFPSCDADAAGRKEAKVRYFNTPGGVRSVVVPRDHFEADRHPRAPLFYDAMQREMNAQ